VIIMVTGIMGTQIAHLKIFTISLTKLIDILVETTFLVALSYQLYYGTIANAGVMVYGIIIMHKMYRDGLSEAKRVYEDKYVRSKKMLKIFRKQVSLYLSISGTIGTLIGLIALTYYKVDLIEFTKIMMVFNITANIYDYYVYIVYVRKLKKV